MLLPECAKIRDKETKINHLQNLNENAYCPTNKTSITT